MLKLKNKNGITLIALIITIIVMLILVGVTVNVALNGGLFTRAKEAASQTEIASEMDVLQTGALLAIGTDGKVDYSEINLPDGFSGSNGKYTSSNGSRYTVSKSGEVTYLEGKLATYVEYKDLLWRVLKDDETGVELLSANAVGSMSLYYTDASAAANMESDIDPYCQRYLNEEENPWSEIVRNVTHEDLSLMDKMCLTVSGDSTEYFVCGVEQITDKNDPDLKNWYMYYINSAGEVVSVHLFDTMSWGEMVDIFNTSTITKAVRPIYTLEAGVLDNLEGSGTFEEPYILAD